MALHAAHIVKLPFAGKPDDRPSLPNPIDGRRRIRAVLFDLDGTLYWQAALRLCMAFELLTLPLAGPFAARRRWRALTAYRRAQEHLRTGGAAAVPTRAQTAAAALEAGLPLADVEALVAEWMHRRPLKYLPLVRSRGVLQVLEILGRAGVPAGVLSDYPAEDKLRALGLADRFAPVLCAGSEGINALKPNPRGFLRACAIWKLVPGEVLMVGDRPDVDAAGAHAAGMPCVIIGRRSSPRRGASYLSLSSFARLARVFDDRR